MAMFSILPSCVLLCALALCQGRHFLVETEDSKEDHPWEAHPGTISERADDYASNVKLLSKKEEGAILDAFKKGKHGKKIVELYHELNSTMKHQLQRMIRSSFGEDLEAMVEGAKDGSIAKLVTSSGEECLPLCVVVPWLLFQHFAPPLIALGATALENSEKGGGCFSSSSTVQTPSGVIAIKDLMLNDSVLTFTPGLGAHYTEMLGWLDRSRATPTKFVEVFTSNSGLITLSASHVIFRFSKIDGAFESLYAGQLAVGDHLVQLKNGDSEEILQAVEVLSLKEVWDSGYWAPFTSSGTLLVDGFLASSYASFPHDYSQVAFAPVKMFPRLLLDNEASQHKDGVREVVKMMKKAGQTLGLRRRDVEKSDGKRVEKPIFAKVEKRNIEKPSFVARALDTLVAGFEKHAEL